LAAEFVGQLHEGDEETGFRLRGSGAGVAWGVSSAHEVNVFVITIIVKRYFVREL